MRWRYRNSRLRLENWKISFKYQEGKYFEWNPNRNTIPPHWFHSNEDWRNSWGSDPNSIPWKSSYIIGSYVHIVCIINNQFFSVVLKEYCVKTRIRIKKMNFRMRILFHMESMYSKISKRIIPYLYAEIFFKERRSVLAKCSLPVDIDPCLASTLSSI